MQEAALDPHLIHALQSQNGEDGFRFETKVIKVDPHNFQDAELDEAVKLLRAGEVVAFPTETVYGLMPLARDCLMLSILTRTWRECFGWGGL